MESIQREMHFFLFLNSLHSIVSCDPVDTSAQEAELSACVLQSVCAKCILFECAVSPNIFQPKHTITSGSSLEIIKFDSPFSTPF